MKLLKLARFSTLYICTLGAKGFLREEPQSGEKRTEQKVRKPLVALGSLPCANRFELGSRSDPAS